MLWLAAQKPSKKSAAFGQICPNHQIASRKSCSNCLVSDSTLVRSEVVKVYGRLNVGCNLYLSGGACFGDWFLIFADDLAIEDGLKGVARAFGAGFLKRSLNAMSSVR